METATNLFKNHVNNVDMHDEIILFMLNNATSKTVDEFAKMIGLIREKANGNYFKYTQALLILKSMRFDINDKEI
jgi:hypothetical protein